MKLGDDNIIYYTGNSIIKTEYNGENIKNLNQKLRFEYPLNLCEYDEEYIAFIIKDGIVKMNKNTGKLTYLYHISLDYLGIGKLCIYNNSIFFEYSDAKVHPFRKFRAPFSGKAEHTFPE